MLNGAVLSAKTFLFYFFFFCGRMVRTILHEPRFFFSLFKPADEMRVNPRTCGRESSI